MRWNALDTAFYVLLAVSLACLIATDNYWGAATTAGWALNGYLHGRSRHHKVLR